MKHNVQHMDYEPIELTGDPIKVAADEGLVGTHSIETRNKIGAWRWPLLWIYQTPVKELLDQAEVAIDFGGAAGPIGYNTVIVDRITHYRSLMELPVVPIDIIVTCHTLEHIVDVWLCVGAMFAKLRPGGALIVLVPSWEAEKLRADVWPSHAHTMRLTGDDCDCEALELDKLLMETGFRILRTDAQYENIIIFAQKPY